MNSKKNNEMLVVSSGKIIGDYIGVRNANGDVCDIYNAKYQCRIHPNNINKFIESVKKRVNGEEVIEYKGLKIPKEKINELEENLYKAKEYVGNPNPLYSILIS